MLRFALLGAGRIGRLHADNIATSDRAALVRVYDVVAEHARVVADRHGAEAVTSEEQALADGVDAVLIASSTDTHVELITAAAAAGRAVLCEKPIDLDIAPVERCRAALAGNGAPVQIGFNRRYDPHHRALRDAVRAGAVGRLEMLLISSRDPAPPPLAYVEVSGGLFRDMMIHDFDMARFVLGEEPVAVSAMASALVDPAIGTAGDVDTAMATLRTASGVLCHIDNSRRAVYGYDQRIEAFGEAGMIRSDNPRSTTLRRYGATATEARDPLLPFFLERYRDSYRAELDDFVDAVEAGRSPSVTFEDGRRALLLANAAQEAARRGREVKVAAD